MKAVLIGTRLLVAAWLVEAAVEAGIAASLHKPALPRFEPQAKAQPASVLVHPVPSPQCKGPSCPPQPTQPPQPTRIIR